jgi:hypothetical protein
VIERLGFAPVDVLRHIVTDRPWLATDSQLDPPPSGPGAPITQTDAWILADASPLGAEVESFLAAGESSVYFGFGSMPLPKGTGRTLIEVATPSHRRGGAGARSRSADRRRRCGGRCPAPRRRGGHGSGRESTRGCRRVNRSRQERSGASLVEMTTPRVRHPAAKSSRRTRQRRRP